MTTTETPAQQYRRLKKMDESAASNPLSTSHIAPTPSLVLPDPVDTLICEAEKRAESVFPSPLLPASTGRSSVYPPCESENLGGNKTYICPVDLLDILPLRKFLPRTNP